MSKIATAIVEELQPRLVREKLLEMPSMISAQKATIRVLREEFKEKEDAVKLAEAGIMAEIAAEVDPAKGKPVYSNKESRDAELARRRSIDSGYLAASKVARQASYKLEEAQDELERLQDLFKSYRYVAKLVSSELSLYAADEEEDEPELNPAWAGKKAAGNEPY